jgi:hypothetical protein
MLESGYVKDYRSVLSWEWYKDANTSRLFRHLVLTVNYEDCKWRGKIVKRGQRVTSYQQLSFELGISVQGIRTAIKHLKSTGEITYVGTRENSIITVNNYDNFQQPTCELTDHQQTINRPSTDHQQQCNKDKKDKNDNKYTLPVPRPVKHKYGEYKNVLLSDSDIEKLKAKFPDWQDKIEILSKGIELKGYKYKNHYLAILKWAERDSPQKSTKKEKALTFDIDEYERDSVYGAMKTKD